MAQYKHMQGAVEKWNNPDHDVINGDGSSKGGVTTYTPGKTDPTFDYTQSSKQLQSRYQGDKPKIGSKIKSAISTIKSGVTKVKSNIKSEVAQVKSDVQTLSADKGGATRHKIAKDLREVFTPNVEVDAVKGEKTRYKKGSEHTTENIILTKKINRPTITGERIRGGSKMGQERTKTKYFKHGKAKGEIKSVETVKVTGKDTKRDWAGPVRMNIDTESTGSYKKYTRKGKLKKDYSDVHSDRFKPKTIIGNIAKGTATAAAIWGTGITVVRGIGKNWNK